MKKKFLIGVFFIILAIVGIVIVLSNENALVVHPKGIIAESELRLIIANIVLMLIIILPTYVLLFTVVWKYCIKKENISYDPDHSHGAIGELLMWGLPSLVIAVMGALTWQATHQLNPYKPIESDVPPLHVQVIALNWKWLFIYPAQGIATLNDFHLPAATPIHLRLTADESPMNSFWIPQLSGQIYSMTGMTTQLYLMASSSGEYTGRAVEINGEGYADMTFDVRSTSTKDFEEWVKSVKQSPSKLNDKTYNELTQPAVNKSRIHFSEVEKNLYNKVVEKYMYTNHSYHASSTPPVK